MIDPSKRISAKEALKHCFFHSVVCFPISLNSGFNWRSILLQKTQVKKFNARKTFKLAILCVRVLIRIKHYRFTPELLNMDIIRTEPYKIKILRKVSVQLFEGIMFISYNFAMTRQSTGVPSACITTGSNEAKCRIVRLCLRTVPKWK